MVATRDSRGRFTGGPRLPGAGRKKGSLNIEKRVIRKGAIKVAEERLKTLTGRAIEVLERNLGSDDEAMAVAAAKLVLQKVIADEKHKGHAVKIPGLAEELTLTGKTRLIDAALGDGRITPEQSKTLLSALRDAAEVADIEQTRLVLDLVRKGRPLNEALAQVDTKFARLKLVSNE